MPLPVRVRVGGLRHVRNCGSHLSKEQGVLVAPYRGRESGERSVNQSIGRPIDAEHVMRNEELRTVGEICSQLVAKQKASPQVGQVLLDRYITPRQSGPSKRVNGCQELANEDIKHREAPHGADTAFGQRFAQSAPASQHSQKCLAGLFVVGIRFTAEIDLWENFQD